MVPYRERVVECDDTCPGEGVDDSPGGDGPVSRKEAERDQEADEGVEEGSIEDVRDQVEREIVGPGFGGGRRQVRSCGYRLHCPDRWFLDADGVVDDVGLVSQHSMQIGSEGK